MAADTASQGRSLAAGQAGLAHYYYMASDSFWKRSDDGRFSAYKDLSEPARDKDWWVSTAYRSDTAADFGRSSFSQDYSSILIGYESEELMKRWSGSLHQGAFYSMNTSTAYWGSHSGEGAYGGGSDSMKDYGGGYILHWENEKDQHGELVFRLSQTQHSLSYSDSEGNSSLTTYRTWLPSLGVRYYQTKLLKNDFFWEPQAGFSLGYLPGYTVNAKDGVRYQNDDKLLVMPHLGLMAGKAYTVNGHAGLAYGRIAWQYAANGGAHGTLKSRDGSETYADGGLHHDTWYDMTVGTSLSLGKDNKIWGELTRRMGEHLDPSWSVSGGLVLKWGGSGKTVRERMKWLKKDPHSLPLDPKKGNLQEAAERKKQDQPENSK